jgi:hypothetical protein
MRKAVEWQAERAALERYGYSYPTKAIKEDFLGIP